MPYKFTICTDDYVCMQCSKKNWEAGTINDYMLSINGLTRTLHSLKECMWQLELFRGNSFLHSEYSLDNKEENSHLSDKYVKFLKRNKITYKDRLCGFDRTQYLSAYGIPMGYVDIEKYLDTLKKEGYAKIDISQFYDIRQKGFKKFKGCYIELRKSA